MSQGKVFSDRRVPHHTTAECRYCEASFSVENEILSLRDRVKELESKLGAADAGLSTDREAVGERPITASSPPAAPSTYWSEEAGIITVSRHAPMLAGRFQIGVLPEKIDELVRLHRFAATVTKWWEDTNNERGLQDYLRLDEIITAFVVGEEQPSTESAVDQEKPT